MVPPDDLDLDDVDVLEPGPPAWAALAGQWSFEGPHAHYNGPDPDEPLADLGLAVTDETLLKGTVSALISLPDTTAAGRLMFGHDPETGEHLSCGIGGGRWAYVLDQFVLGRGWITLLARGFHTNLAPDTEYAVTVAVFGQNAGLFVDDVLVLSHALPGPLPGRQAGVVAWGSGGVRFRDVEIGKEPPRVFVVMQFGGQFDSLYSEVIRPVCDRMALEAIRVDDVYQPGVILHDIIQSIRDADIIIAEITPPNPNVFYELGFAHATDKPTILLAERGETKLPFDVSGYRVIFYDNTIEGKSRVEHDLDKHLNTIIGTFR